MLDPHQREGKRRKNIAKRIAKTINKSTLTKLYWT
jgi:hypothetical protein